MRHALTLAEVLIVIVIISILSSMAISIAGSVYSSAVCTACLSNLRQVGVAAHLYADENGNHFPADSNKGINNPDKSPAWFYRLPEYASGVTTQTKHSIFQCAGFKGWDPLVFNNASPKSLKMNSYLDKTVKKDRYRRHSKRGESTTIFFIDAIAGETGMGQWGHCAYSGVDDSRHEGKVNVLYLDGRGLSSEPVPELDKDGKYNWKEVFRWIPGRKQK